MKTIEPCPNCGLELAFDEAMRSVTLCPRCEKPLVASPSSMSLGASVSLVPCPGTTPGAALVELGCGTHTLGRKSAKSIASVQIDVNDLFMSKRHTQLSVMRGPGGMPCVTVRDAGSSNGTFINERRLAPLEEVTLVNGDSLRMGNTSFTVLIN